MSVSVEIIDFTRPVANSKNLYITGIVSDSLTEAQITTALYEAGSTFGLVYEVQVFPGVRSQGLFSTSSRGHTPASSASSFYAFLKFYSYQAARKAKAHLSKSLKLGTQVCKVVFASRSKETESGATLYVSKCQELANYYLGFNGWSSAIKRLEEDNEAGKENTLLMTRVRFFCHVELSFPNHGLSTLGIGAWEELYSCQDTSSKCTAILKARKRSHQRAMEHAFSHVLLVVLSNGKVTVEINTVKPDDITQRQIEAAAEEQVLTVNELDKEPQEEEEEEEEKEMKSECPVEGQSKKLDIETTQDIDYLNLQILQELGDGLG